MQADREIESSDAGFLLSAGNPFNPPPGPLPMGEGVNGYVMLLSVFLLPAPYASCFTAAKTAA